MRNVKHWLDAKLAMQMIAHGVWPNWLPLEAGCPQCGCTRWILDPDALPGSSTLQLCETCSVEWVYWMPRYLLDDLLEALWCPS